MMPETSDAREACTFAGGRVGREAKGEVKCRTQTTFTHSSVRVTRCYFVAFEVKHERYHDYDPRFSRAEPARAVCAVSHYFVDTIWAKLASEAAKHKIYVCV